MGAQCAEAIGAIAPADKLALLEEFAKDSAPEVSETCAIAVKRVKWALVRAACGVGLLWSTHTRVG